MRDGMTGQLLSNCPVTAGPPAGHRHASCSLGRVTGRTCPQSWQRRDAWRRLRREHPSWSGGTGCVHALAHLPKATEGSGEDARRGGCLLVEGGARLSGHVAISGAKNAALVALAAALLSRDPVILRDVPDLADVTEMCDLLEGLGVRMSRESAGLVVNAAALSGAAPSADVASRLRASFLVIGPLLARLGVAHVPLPGGCDIGRRPVDIHVDVLRALGASVRVCPDSGMVSAQAPLGGLVGADFRLRFPSVGATETAVMAAALARGRSVIRNTAREPEVEDLIRLVNGMGGRVRQTGSTITVHGVERLGSTEHAIIPDRIEAGTFMVAAAATGSSISLGPVMLSHVRPLVDVLTAAGCQIRVHSARDAVGGGAGRGSRDAAKGARGNGLTDGRASRLPSCTSGAGHGAGHGLARGREGEAGLGRCGTVGVVGACSGAPVADVEVRVGDEVERRRAGVDGTLCHGVASPRGTGVTASEAPARGGEASSHAITGAEGPVTLSVHVSGPLFGVDVTTAPFPGFPTDMQPVLMALLPLCSTPSTVTETVFEDRMRHVDQLAALGACVSVDAAGRCAQFAGSDRLRGARVVSGDLRAAAGLVVAGLAAEGVTVVEGLGHLDRGYDRLEEKLRALGARVTRVDAGATPPPAGPL